MKKNLKSIGAVVGGLVAIVVLSGVASAVLTNAGVYPDGKLPLVNASWLLIIGMLASQALFYFVGCFVTLKLAPSNPMKHVLILGALGAVLNLLSGMGLAMKDGVAFFWFYLALAALSLLVAWGSGKWYAKRASGKK